MSEKGMVITYETLFELLRLEKNRDELQALDSNFFRNVLDYLCERKRTVDETQSQTLLFERDDKEKARLEYENVKKILKDLYDRREKKILNLALNKSRSGISLVNMSSMLPSEQELFHAINLTLSKQREDTLFKLVSGELPSCTGASYAEGHSDISNDSGAGNDSDGQVYGHFQTPEQHSPISQSLGTETKELKTPSFLNEFTANVKKVRFLTAVDEIIGPDLQIYGPYDLGVITELPKELAAVLIEKKQAEEA